MKHLVSKILMVCLVIWPLSTVAQNISVSSFKLLDSDLTANTTGTMERDQNGEVAALIKVVTSEQGFVFDGGMTGIVKTKQEVGEVWVYVPHGIKKMTIKHPQLGVLRDYFFPISIDKAKTYELILTTGKVETVVTRTASKQYVVFNVSPTNAIVELDDMPLDVSSEGYAEKSVAYGTYHYRVSAANYHTEAGQVTVSAQGKSNVNVKLRPNFGWIEVKGADEYHGAHVYVDNEHVGQLPMKSGAIGSGVHQVKVMKSLYKPYEQQVTVTDDNTTSLIVQMEANFANVTFVADAESEVWVDGKQRGKGKCTIGLEIGEYTVEVKRASHRTVSEVVSITDITPRTIQLSSPTPIYGILDITSTPSRATVYIDGVEVGETPLMKSDVLVGAHRITFQKEGYERVERSVDVNENVDNKLSVTLNVPTAESKSHTDNGTQEGNKTYTVNGVSFTMIAVKGGTFMMGSKEEKPVHQVTLSDYAIGETEVTQELWKAVMGNNPSRKKGGGLQCPVEQVSWEDCQVFITRLNELTGNTFRLPTEAEWEFAARGGNASKGYKYSGSNTPGDVAWYFGNSSTTTRPVKTKQANELGIYDMSGNVWEWCADWYGDYPSFSQTNPIGPSSGRTRVLRGGAWGFDKRYSRVDIRGLGFPDDAASSSIDLYYGRGLRLAQ